MAKFTWDDYQPVKAPQDDGKGFDWNAYEAEGDPSKSAVTAATTGLIEGAVPFAKSIAGAGHAAMNAITGVTGPLAGGSLEDVVKDYRQSRDSFAEDAKKSSDAHPGIAFAGNLAGGGANPLFQAASGLTGVVKGASGLAGAGALQSLGEGSADLTKGELGEGAKDAALGAAGGLVGYGAGKALPKLWEGTKYFGKKALTNFGPSVEAIDARLAGKAQDTARNYPQLAEDMRDSLKQVSQKTRELGQEASQYLSSDPQIPKVTVTDVLDKNIKDLGLQGNLIGPTDKKVSSTLTGLREDLEKLPDNLSEKDLKSVIKKMDDNINWDDQSQDKLNSLLEGIRTDFDQSLKFRNSKYKDAMKPVAAQTGLLQDLRRQFNFKNIPGEGLQPTDTTATKIQTSLRDNKAVTEGKLKDLAELTGKDYSDLANDYRLSQQFQKTGAQGSKRTNIGAAIGTALGGLSGGFVGAGAGAGLGSLAGGAMDAYGGKVAGKIIDSYVKAGNLKPFGKFAPIIEKAASRGPEALAVVGSMLGNDPEFKKQMGISGP